LITGGAGFIGSNFIRHVLQEDPDAHVTNLDLLTYAGIEATVVELDRDPRHTFIKGDIRDASLVNRTVPGHDVILNFAAETHIDRSISSPSPFLETNVVGTGVLLDAASRHEVPTFIQVSTDEVYGSIAAGSATEDASLAPSSPYAASKAAADLLVRSYQTTYDYPAIITRCTNNYGPYQFPEKVIPLFVTNLLEDRNVPLYGDGRTERDGLPVEDHCRALMTALELGTPGEIYNIGADAPVANMELTHRILEIMGKDRSFIDFVTDRPGHDLRYAVDSSKIRSLGWKPRHSLDDRLAETANWYRSNAAWWQPLKRTTP
jgi:dTDP-glucose 4,6-dehydratase